jgi:hypothetical protein
MITASHQPLGAERLPLRQNWQTELRYHTADPRLEAQAAHTVRPKATPQAFRSYRALAPLLRFVEFPLETTSPR